MPRTRGPAVTLASMSRMLDEIRRQPETLARTLAADLRGIEKFRASIERRKIRLVVLAARGTSDNAALFGRYLIEILTGIPVSLAAPSVQTVYGARMGYKDALVVGISQSGESTDTNFVLEQARKSGAVTVGITNEPRSTMAGIAESMFLVRAGRERSVAATKTYTGQLMVLYLLAYALGRRSGRPISRPFRITWRARFRSKLKSPRWPSATGSRTTPLWWGAD